MKINDKKTLVLDSSYLPRSIINVERGFVICYKGNAEVVESYPTHFNTIKKDQVFVKPSVIRVFRFVNMEYKKVPLTRKNVFRRDNHTCVYCGNNNPKKLTIDHVVPKSKGGRDRWENLVTSCYGCNQEKANLTIEEWGKENPEPKRPHYLMLVKTIHKIPENWEKYLLF